jgi:hypothetical protein
MDGRKPRSDARLRNLPPDRKTALVDWIVDEGISYDGAVDRLQEQFGIKTSRGAVSDFYRQECFSLRARRNRSDADRIRELLAEQPDAFGEATRSAIAQQFFELSVAGTASPEDLLMLAQIMGASKRLEIEQEKLRLRQEKAGQDERRLQLEQEKVRLMQVKAAEAVLAKAAEFVDIAKDAGLSTQQKIEAVRRRLFGDEHVEANAQGTTHNAQVPEGGSR